MIASTQTNHPLPTNNDDSPTRAALQIACNRLKTAGLRITQPRIAILEALIKRSLPATIEQIHAELASASCDLVTVYRCLAAFEELGLVRRCFFHNGTSLYQSIAAVFIAQALGMDLTFSQQLMIVLTSTLAAIGSAGVPGAGLIMLIVVLESIGVPAAGIALIMAPDRILDMKRLFECRPI